MKNKIALEEHFAIDLTIDQSKIYAPPVVWERLKSGLLDIEQQRLRTEAIAKGYEGEACAKCGNFTLVRNGISVKCNTCGSPTGCS